METACIASINVHPTSAMIIGTLLKSSCRNAVIRSISEALEERLQIGHPPGALALQDEFAGTSVVRQPMHPPFDARRRSARQQRGSLVLELLPPVRMVVDALLDATLELGFRQARLEILGEE